VNLLFDLAATQPLSGRYHGAGEYAKSIFRILAGQPADARLSAFLDPGRWVDPGLIELARQAGIDLLPVAGKGALQRLLRGDRFSRLYSALPYNYYDLDFSEVEFFFTIHGLRPLELPTDPNEARYEPGPATRARATFKRYCAPLYMRRKKEQFARLLRVPTPRRVVIVPSLHTKYSLLAHFPELDPAVVLVYYSPARTPDAGGANATAADLLHGLAVAPRQFFLVISANRWVKNSIRAIEALDQVFSARPALLQRVVVLGADGVRPLDVRLANPGRFTFRGYVEQGQLDALYAHAYALVFPSLNEGFGYPPVEAMRHGTPVICSAAGATTEICGDAVLYVNPLHRQEIQIRALTLLLQPGVWEELSERGRRRSEVVRSRQDAMLDELCHLLRTPSP